ncbi:MAG: phosphonopyruvate decarboxylase [Lachnospiraceae bacterium]|nr:phosphonopyruvate decarboxylase [Lachnospiraceae bacterium]
MKVESFVKELNSDFYTGVPDSLLSALGNYLVKNKGVDPAKHVIAANEGNATAIAAGYHLATGKTPVVYMQNSGQGNVVNPVASLCNDKVYGIPVIFVIGWRGEPGVHDEPQHVFQGEITLGLLDVMNIPYMIVDKETGEEEIAAKMKEYASVLSEGRQVAFVVKKGALTYDEKCEYKNDYSMKRESIIGRIIDVTGDSPVIATTGKTGRELFELRVARGEGHGHDFLTVGSMGHSSSIALGIAAQSPEKKIWIIDGDGAMLMHMGSMAVLGTSGLENIVHIVINNGAHESVGGLPTVAEKMDLPAIAKACGYSYAKTVSDEAGVDAALTEVKGLKGRIFLEIKSAIGSRADLGRPTTTARENKEEFMKQNA